MGFELEAQASIGVAIGDKLDNISEVLKKAPPRPRHLDFKASNIGPGVAILGRPPHGRVWNLLTLTLLGSDDHTTVTGTGALYTDCDSGNLSLMQCKIPNLSIPFFGSIGSKGSLWAHASGDVVVNFQGMGANQQVFAVITVDEWHERDQEGTHYHGG